MCRVRRERAQWRTLVVDGPASRGRNSSRNGRWTRDQQLPPNQGNLLASGTAAEIRAGTVVGRVRRESCPGSGGSLSAANARGREPPRRRSSGSATRPRAGFHGSGRLPRSHAAEGVSPPPAPQPGLGCWPCSAAEAASMRRHVGRHDLGRAPDRREVGRRHQRSRAMSSPRACAVRPREGSAAARPGVRAGSGLGW
jgi:hypothetical protein